MAFEVPPHTAGEGSYPDNGVLTYYPSPNSVPLTWQGDCIVPAGLHQLCTAILNQFIVWDGGPTGPVASRVMPEPLGPVPKHDGEDWRPPFSMTSDGCSTGGGPSLPAALNWSAGSWCS